MTEFLNDGSLASLEAAAAEGLAPNLARFLAFRGWKEGELVELQALDVGRKKSTWAQGREVVPARQRGAYVAHAFDLATLVKLIEEAEGWRDDEGKAPPAVFCIVNRTVDAVAARYPSTGAWHRMTDGATGDSDMATRRVLYSDLDADRPKGISARGPHVARTVERAVSLASIFVRYVPPQALALGHSGNGAGLFAALDDLPCGQETDRLVRAVLVACKHLVSDPETFVSDRRRDDDALQLVAVDLSVSDRKRLCPAFGSWKRKGGDLPDRPHRRTAFLAPEQPHRLSLEELRALALGLRGELATDEARAEFDKALADPKAKAPPKPRPSTSGASSVSPGPGSEARRSAPEASRGAARPAAGAEESDAGDAFRVANQACPVTDVLSRLGLLEGDRPVCPGCRRSNRPGGTIEIVRNGLKCSSATCSPKGPPGFPGFYSVVDLVMEAQGLRNGEALTWLRDEFPDVGIPAPRPRRPRPSTATSSPPADDPAAGPASPASPASQTGAPPGVPPGVPPDGANWESLLSVNKSGLVNTLGNAVTILANDRPWVGVLGYDAFASRVQWRERPPFDGGYAGQHGDEDGYPREVTDEDATRISVWLERHWHVRVPDGVASKALETVARNQSHHPVRAYLEALPWDGRPRIDTWLIDHFGVPDSPYVRWVSRWWLISAVARIFCPGCQADYVLIFEGEQGMKKSTALRALGEPWFCDELPKLDDKDARQQIRGVWICEVAELDALGKTGIAAAKKFFSQSTDRYRPSFGKRAVDFPRQCVFAGSTNDFEYLQDPTGNRRFWPVRVTKRADLDALRRDRDQLWAEARTAFEAGEKWYPETDEEHAACTFEQEQRFQSDLWEFRIAYWLRQNRCSRAIGDPTWEEWTPVHGGEVLKHAINLKADKWDRQAQTRVGQVLARLGWVRGARTMVQGVRSVPWWGPGTPRAVSHGSEGVERLKTLWQQGGPQTLEGDDELPTSCQPRAPGWQQKPAEKWAIANLPTCQPYERAYVCAHPPTYE